MRRIVLVHPSGPRNVGSVVRAAQNLGPAEIVLVSDRPDGLLDHPDFVQMAHGVTDPRDEVRVEATLEAALAGTTQAIGFTARGRDHRALAVWPELRGAVAAAIAAGGSTALVFGNEERGLSNAECAALRTLAWIPTAAAHPSLNLAVAVAIVLHDLHPGNTAPRPSAPPASVSQEQRARLVAHVRETLAAFTRHGSYRADIEGAVDRLFTHAEIETRDARAWHAILRRIEASRGRSAGGGDGEVRPH